MRLSLVSFFLCITCTIAFGPISRPAFNSHIRTGLNALDYSDPVVSEEFTKVQGLTFEDVETELGDLGIPCPPTMNDFDIRMMLVEVRMRSNGTMPGTEKKKREKKASYSNKFEEMLYTKPNIEKMYDEFRENGNNNDLNAMIDYINDKELAITRYGATYQNIFDQVDAAITAKVEVTNPKLDFSGFPSNMGEAALEMTFGALGAVKSINCQPNDDGLTLYGTVEFEEIDVAKVCMKQYDGMDMGLGTVIKMDPVQ